MTDDINTYAEFQLELCDLLEEAQENDLDGVLLAGILLDYRDHIKMRENDSEITANLNNNTENIY